MWSRSLRSLTCLSATSIALSTSESTSPSSLSSAESMEQISYFTQRQGKEGVTDETDYSTSFFDRGFSSGAFVGDDSSAYARFARLHASHNNDDASHNAYSDSTYEDPTHKYARLTRPTIDTYRSMSNEELVALLRTRQQQVEKLRQIYESFHYEVDKHLRTTVLDYHDKALSLSNMHLEMQSKSYSDQRLVLTKLREEQHRMSRDVHIIMFVCIILVICFWVWVRRHYISRVDFQNKLENVLTDELNCTSIGAFGKHSDNLLSSVKFSGRSIETSWEKEMRLKQEAQRKVMQEAAAIATANLAKSQQLEKQQEQQQHKKHEEEQYKEETETHEEPNYVVNTKSM